MISRFLVTPFIKGVFILNSFCCADSIAVFSAGEVCESNFRVATRVCIGSVAGRAGGILSKCNGCAGSISRTSCYVTGVEIDSLCKSLCDGCGRGSFIAGNNSSG